MEEAGPEVQWAGFGRLKERPSLRRRKAVPAHWRWAKFDETLLLLLRREVGPARRSGAGQSEWARPSVSGEAGPGPSRARSSMGRRESGDRRAPRSGAGPAGQGVGRGPPGERLAEAGQAWEGIGEGCAAPTPGKGLRWLWVAPLAAANLAPTGAGLQLPHHPAPARYERLRPLPPVLPCRLASPSLPSHSIFSNNSVRLHYAKRFTKLAQVRAP